MSSYWPNNVELANSMTTDCFSINSPGRQFMADNRRAARGRECDALDQASVQVLILDAGLDTPLDRCPYLITSLLSVLCIDKKWARTNRLERAQRLMLIINVNSSNREQLTILRCNETLLIAPGKSHKVKKKSQIYQANKHLRTDSKLHRRLWSPPRRCQSGIGCSN